MKKLFVRFAALVALLMVVIGIILLPSLVDARGYDDLWLRVKHRLTVGTTDYDARLNVGTKTAAGIGIAVTGVTSQTGNLYEGRDVNESILYSVAPDGDLTCVGFTTTGDVSLAGDTTLGDAAADEHIVNGRIASSYYQTVTGAEVNAWNRNHCGGFTGKIAESGHTIKQSINDFAGGFIAAQLGEEADGITDFNITGLESKATVDRDAGGTSVGTGFLAKMIARKDGTTLATGYAVTALIETNNSAVITTAANFFADLVNGASLGTVAILSSAADTWDTGIDLANATLTSDIVLQNSETIVNSTNNLVAVSGALTVKSYTADPCPTLAVEGVFFWNGTSDYFCYCDGSSADLKMVDNSTACF